MPSDPAICGYLAGIIDGEGCIRRNARFANWTVAVGMTDAAIIEWLHLMGGSFSVGKRKPPHRDVYLWRLLAQNDLLVFLRAVMPYLRVKKAVAVEAVAEIEARQALRADELELA